MGIRLTAINEDFSSFSYGSLGPSTSVSSGLLALGATYQSASLSIKNFAPGGFDFVENGTPTYQSDSVVSDNTNFIDFGIDPTGGDRTMAFVSYMETGTRFPFSAFVTTGGFGEYLEYTGADFRFATARTASANFPTLPRVDNRFEFYVVRVVNTVSLELIRPRTSDVSLKSTPGIDFNFTGRPYRTGIVNNAATARTALFGFWDRALSDTEINTVYADVTQFLASIGADIT